MLLISIRVLAEKTPLEVGGGRFVNCAEAREANKKTKGREEKIMVDRQQRKGSTCSSEGRVY